MRKCQISITMELYDGEKPEKVEVYADANNVWEAASAGIAELMTALQKKRELPAFGAKTSRWEG